MSAEFTRVLRGNGGGKGTVGRSSVVAAGSPHAAFTISSNARREPTETDRRGSGLVLIPIRL